MAAYTKLAPSYSNPDPRALAIIGMSISAPGGEDAPNGLDNVAFYEFLTKRGSGTIRVPSDRWNADAYYGKGPGQICTTKGSFIPNITGIADMQEFGITGNESTQMAVTQVHTIHQAFQALQRSGIDFRGSTTGVYVGCAGGGAPCELDITECREYYMTGTSLSITANRVSFVFDMMGPSLPVDTACSSSLTAMHLAAQAVRNGECDQAVVAGVNMILGPLETSSFSQLGVLSPDGISKSFDESANGYARADVMSAVVIKRHDLAIRDGDHIHATLVGTALTSCGSLMGSLTTPSPEAQIQAIRNAYADAALAPHLADFVELHGTGTTVGDSLEANAAGEVFSEGRNGREVVIGSVKSNIGHGEMGAYMSSLVKTVMMLEKGVILPNGFFKNPSPKIHFDKYNLRVPLAVEDLIPGNPELGLIASISSFGFGGSCGHTVLRAHECRPTLTDYDNYRARQGPYLFSIGAWSPRAAGALAAAYKADFASEPAGALSEHLGSRARQAPFRTFAVADSIVDAKFSDAVVVPKRSPPLVFCFSGQGPQHWAMGRDLFARFTAFRESILASDAVHKEYTGFSFLEETGLFVKNKPEGKPLEKSMLWPADAISVGITFFQIALFDLLTYLDLKPTAVVGHSIGETAVLYASGAMPRDMVVKIAIARGRALKLVDSMGGTMVAVSGCDAATVQDHIEATMDIASQTVMGDLKPGDALHIAAYNSPTDVGVSGPEILVDQLTRFIDSWVDGVKATKLRVSTAVHSPYVDPCEASYREELRSIFDAHPGRHVPKIPTVSTVTANFAQEEYTIDYLWSNLRQPVRFCPAIASMISKYGETTFVEMAPHPVLTAYLKNLGASEVVAGSKRPPSARRIKAGIKPPTEVHILLESLGQLLIAGVNSVNFAKLNGCPPRRFDGPAYPFQKRFQAIAPNVPSHVMKQLPRQRPLNAERLRVSATLPEPWMGDHVIDHSNIIPAAAYIEMLLEFPGVTQVWDARFEAACILDPAVPAVTIQVKNEGHIATIKTSTGLETLQGDLSWTRGDPNFDVLHASGKLGYGKPELSPRSMDHLDMDALQDRCMFTHDREELYEDIVGFANFGPEFMRINRAISNTTEALCWVRGSTSLNQTDYHVHPAIIDACLQCSIVFNLQYDKINVGDTQRDFLLPASLERAFRNSGSTDPLNFPDEFQVYVRMLEWSPDSWTFDAYCLAENGEVLFSIEGVRFERVQQGITWPSNRFTLEWQPYAIPEDMSMTSSSLSGVSAIAEEVSLLQLLDLLATSYTQELVSSLPADFSVSTSDRQRYLQWCRAQAAKTLVGPPSSIVVPANLNEKYSALFELSERVGKGQQDICQSSTATVDLLFTDDIMPRIYEHPPFQGSVFAAIADEFVALVRRIAATGKKVIRVLEVGAGTGRLTAILGRALLAANIEGIYIDYVCTDISISLAQEAAAHTPWMTVTPLALNLNTPLAEQRVDPASFDIVTAFDVLHATPSLSDTLSVLRRLLMPGGYLAIVELDGRAFRVSAHGSIWMDFIFGGFSEWFGVLDQRDEEVHCTLDEAGWDDLLSAQNFSTVFLKPRNKADIVDHFAFISQAIPPREVFFPVTSPSPVARGASPSSSIASETEVGTPFVMPAHRRGTGSFGSLKELKSVLSLAHSPKVQEFASITPAMTPPVVTPPAEVKSMEVDHFDEDRRTSTPSQFVYHFKAGGELELVAFFAEMNPDVAHNVWLHTTTADDDATLIGLARTLRQEFSMYKIFLVLFDPSWSASYQKEFIRSKLQSLDWIDAEIKVEIDGSLKVPRIVAAVAPPRVELAGKSVVQFEIEGKQGADLWRGYLPPLGPNDVEIAVCFMSASPAFPSFSEFSGRIVGTGIGVNKAKYPVDQWVFGLASTVKGNVIVCSSSCIAPLPREWSTLAGAAVAGRVVFASLTNTLVRQVYPVKTSILLHAGNGSQAAVSVYKALDHMELDVVVTADDECDGAAFSKYGKQSQPPIKSSDVSTWSMVLRRQNPEGIQLAFSFDSSSAALRETVSCLAPRGTLVCIGTPNAGAPVNLKFSQRIISIDFEELAKEMLLIDCLANVSRTLISELMPQNSVVSMRHLRALDNLPSNPDKSTLVDFGTMCSDIEVLKGGVKAGTQAFDPRKSYVVIGGIGGLGVNIARVLVELGARHVVLTSRSGEAAFANNRLIRERKILNWLNRMPGVKIDLVALDCSDLQSTKALFRSLKNPIGGIFHLAVRLADALFTSMTSRDAWDDVYDVKVKGFQNLLYCIDPKSVDFIVLTSSMASVLGSPGQANYSAAQSWMEAIAASIPNATTITVPPLTDGGVFVRSMPKGNARNAALDKYKALGMTGYQLARHCVDAIWSIGSANPISLYIPPTNWKKSIEIAVRDYHLSLTRHLLTKESSSAGQKESQEKTIRFACASVLSLDTKDVEDGVPLSSYGLDSLTSARLSTILKAHFDLNVTQLQLLGGNMTVARLEAMRDEQKAANASATAAQTTSSSNDTLQEDLANTLVRLNNVTEGKPMFIMHGAGGGVLVFQKFAENLPFPVYGVQDTEEAPVSGTLNKLARFYVGKIREKQPHGPYRLAGFSFGSALSLEIAGILRDEGEEIESIIMIDGSPTLFERPKFRAHTMHQIASGSIREDIMGIVSDMSHSQALDGAGDLPSQFQTHFSHGDSGPAWIRRFCSAYTAHVLMGVRAALHREQNPGKGEENGWPATRTVLIKGTEGVGAQTYAEGATEKFDLDMYTDAVEVHTLEGTHFGILHPSSGISDVLTQVYA